MAFETIESALLARGNASPKPGKVSKSVGVDPALASIAQSFAQAAKRISALVRKGGLAGVLGEAGSENVQGENQKKLDVLANELVKEALRANPCARAGVSEEDEEFFTLKTAGQCDAPRQYVVLFDPLDGSSNIDVNVSVGTIFSVYEIAAGKEIEPSDFLRQGQDQAMAGFFVYGPRTELILACAGRTLVFTLDPERDEFILTADSPQVPEQCAEFAVNMSNRQYWQAPVREYVDELMAGKNGPRGKYYNMRWVASMVAEVDRILNRGGVFMYPWDAKNPQRAGKLRLMYEANPMALIMENCGAAASTGRGRILEARPTSWHERVPVFLGAKEEVDRVTGMIERHESKERAARRGAGASGKGESNGDGDGDGDVGADSDPERGQSSGRGSLRQATPNRSIDPEPQKPRPKTRVGRARAQAGRSADLFAPGGAEAGELGRVDPADPVEPATAAKAANPAEAAEQCAPRPARAKQAQSVDADAAPSAPGAGSADEARVDGALALIADRAAARPTPTAKRSRKAAVRAPRGGVSLFDGADGSDAPEQTPAAASASRSRTPAGETHPPGSWGPAQSNAQADAGADVGARSRPDSPTRSTRTAEANSDGNNDASPSTKPNQGKRPGDDDPIVEERGDGEDTARPSVSTSSRAGALALGPAESPSAIRRAGASLGGNRRADPELARYDYCIHTDGACSGNPGPGGWGAVIDDLRLGQTREMSGAARVKTTNNRMELQAAIEALRAIKEPSRILVRSDSQYVVNGMNGWLAGWIKTGRIHKVGKGEVQNASMWMELKAAADFHRLVAWEWVRGHNGDALNERADRLAVAGSERSAKILRG